ncbi:hypothetical protein ACJO5Y_15085 [Marinobacter sp. GN3S48]|uniref:hypothetical protein n=1 Tax=Marinobacter sp. GN3S48 TaxID=3382302 RepID=UPI00387B1C2E
MVALDIDSQKVQLLNDRISPIEDAKINQFLSEKELNLTATLDKQEADVILANRLTPDFEDVRGKVYTGICSVVTGAHRRNGRSVV